MSTPVRMPQIGETMVAGTIGLWLKHPGDYVHHLDPLVQIETEKVITEIPSPLEGRLLEHVAAEGDSVPVGAPIALVEEATGSSPQEEAPAGREPAAPTAPATPPTRGPDDPSPAPPSSAASAGGATAPGGAATDLVPGGTGPRPDTTGIAATDSPPSNAVGLFPSSPLPSTVPAHPALLTHRADPRTAGTTAEPIPDVAPDHAGSRLPPMVAEPTFSPAVRRLAAEYGVNPRTISGTGAGGRVTREDVLGHASRLRAAGEVSPTAGSAHPDIAPPSALRRVIAQRMVESIRNVPHAWMMVEADVTALVRLRQGMRAEFRQREGFDLTYFPFFVKGVVEGLRAQPALHASWTDEGILYHHDIHLAVAVATESGLVVPVLRSPDGMSVAGLARAVHHLAERARSGDLAPEDMRGATFTVNNTGALGSVLSVPIISPPQAGIVTLEAVQAKPAVVGEGIAVRHLVNLALSFDHRLADGLTAGRFMQKIKTVLESFQPGDPLY